MIFLILISLVTQSVFASDWQLKHGSTKIVLLKKQKDISLLQFIKNSQPEKKFQAKETPFVMSNFQKITLNNRELFLTYWPSGARAQVLRVFEPEKNAMPICEVTTFSSKNAIRLVEDRLEVESFKDPVIHKKKNLSQWNQCHNP